MRDIDAISGEVVNLAIRIHRELGPGLLESVDETVMAAMAAKLARLGVKVATQGLSPSSSKE